jgi:hypothetical protein
MKLIQGRYRYASAHDMYELLGVKSLPKEGMAECLIQGVRVYVSPLICPVEKSGWNGKHMRRNWQGLRVMAICDCGRHIPVGRMHQHKCEVK